MSGNDPCSIVVLTDLYLDGTNDNIHDNLDVLNTHHHYPRASDSPHAVSDLVSGPVSIPVSPSVPRPTFYHRRDDSRHDTNHHTLQFVNPPAAPLSEFNTQTQVQHAILSQSPTKPNSHSNLNHKEDAPHVFGTQQAGGPRGLRRTEPPSFAAILEQRNDVGSSDTTSTSSGSGSVWQRSLAAPSLAHAQASTPSMRTVQTNTTYTTLGRPFSIGVGDLVNAEHFQAPWPAPLQARDRNGYGYEGNRHARADLGAYDTNIQVSQYPTSSSPPPVITPHASEQPYSSALQASHEYAHRDSLDASSFYPSPAPSPSPISGLADHSISTQTHSPIGRRDSFIVYPRRPESPPLNVPRLSAGTPTTARSSGSASTAFNANPFGKAWRNTPWHTRDDRSGRLLPMPSASHATSARPQSHWYDHDDTRGVRPYFSSPMVDQEEHDIGSYNNHEDGGIGANDGLPDWLASPTLASSGKDGYGQLGSIYTSQEKMSPAEKEERVRMLEAAFNADSSTTHPHRTGLNAKMDQIMSSGAATRGRGTVIFRDAGRKLRISVRWMQFLCAWAAAIASFYALIVSTNLSIPQYANSRSYPHLLT